MKFTKNELRICEQNGTKVGKWKDCPIYAISKENWVNDNHPGSVGYIIYDDGNALVIGEKLYGYVSEGGNVREMDMPTEYHLRSRVAKERAEKQEKVENKAFEKSMGVGEIDVDALLADACSDDWIKALG